EAAADSIRPRALDKGVEVEVKVPQSLPPVAADARRLGHALDNLLGNAVAHTDRGGRVTLSATAADGAVTLTVADTGEGIPPEHFLTMIRQQKRGRLKVYLGFAAGVGKTYEMLQEGHRLRRQGVDVVIGFVETHGRAETFAQVGDLEQVPRRRIEYKGVVLEEMD